MSYYASNFYASNYYASNYYAGAAADLELFAGAGAFSIFEFDIAAQSAIRLDTVGQISGISTTPIDAFSLITINEGANSIMTIGCGEISIIELFDTGLIGRIAFNRAALSEIDIDGTGAISGISLQATNKFSIITIQEGIIANMNSGCGAVSTITINVSALSIIQ